MFRGIGPNRWPNRSEITLHHSASHHDVVRFMRLLTDLERRGQSAEGPEIAAALRWTPEHARDVAEEVHRKYRPSALDISFDGFGIDPM